MHNYIEGQMKVIVCTFDQPIIGSVDNCIWIFIAQLYRRANESNCIHFVKHFLHVLIIACGFSLYSYIEGQMKVIVCTFCQPFLARVDKCTWIFIVQLYRRTNESYCMYILSTISCKG